MSSAVITQQLISLENLAKTEHNDLFHQNIVVVLPQVYKALSETALKSNQDLNLVRSILRNEQCIWTSTRFKAIPQVCCWKFFLFLSFYIVALNAIGSTKQKRFLSETVFFCSLCVVGGKYGYIEKVAVGSNFLMTHH